MEWQPMKPQTFRVRMRDWEREREAMRAIRTPVFIQEQQVPQDDRVGRDGSLVRACPGVG